MVRITFRKKIYGSVEQLQQDLDAWMHDYNHNRTHQGKYCCGKTPMETFLDALEIAKEKILNAA